MYQKASQKKFSDTYGSLKRKAQVVLFQLRGYQKLASKVLVASKGTVSKSREIASAKEKLLIRVKDSEELKFSA